MNFWPKKFEFTTLALASMLGSYAILLRQKRLMEEMERVPVDTDTSRCRYDDDVAGLGFDERNDEVFNYIFMSQVSECQPKKTESEQGSRQV